MCKMDITVSSGGILYTLKYTDRTLLEMILRTGPVYENTFHNVEGLKKLLDLNLITKVIVEGCREKIASTPTGMLVYDKMNAVSIETDLSLPTTGPDGYIGMSLTTTDAEAEVAVEIDKLRQTMS